MERFRKFEFCYNWDKGFCINFYNNYDDKTALAYFGSGKFEEVSRSYDVATNAIDYYYNQEKNSYNNYLNAKPIKFDYADLKVIRPKKGSINLDVEIKEGRKTHHVTCSSYSITCNCGTYKCQYVDVVKNWITDCLDSIMESYLYESNEYAKDYFISAELADILLGYSKKQIDLVSIKNSKKNVKNLIANIGSVSYARRVFYFLMHNEPFYYNSTFLDKYTDFFYALLENDFCYDAIVKSEYYKEEDCNTRQTKSNKTFFKRILRSFEKAKKDIEKNGILTYEADDDLRYLYLAVTDNKDLLIKYFASVSPMFDTDHLTILDNLIKDKEVFKDNKESIIKIILTLDNTSNSEEVNQLICKYLNLLDRNERIEVISLFKKNLLPASYLDELSDEEQKKIIFSINPTESSVSKILNEVLLGEDPKLIGRYILFVIHWCILNQKAVCAALLFKYAHRLPNSQLLFAYLTGVFGKNKEGLTFPPKGDEEAEILDYFDTLWIFNELSNNVNCTFYVKNPFFNDRFLVKVDEENGHLNLTNSFIKFEYEVKPESIINACIKGTEEEYKKKRIEQENRVAILNFSKKNSEFTKDMAALQESLSNDTAIILSNDNLASIDFAFGYEYGYGYLSFKIGIRKKYQVKDAAEFLDYFRNGETVSYGKDLTFTHDLDNIVEDDRAALQLLIPARLTSGRIGDSRNKKYITLPGTLFSGLLSTLKNRTITFNEVETTIRLKPHYLTATIDKSYKINTNVAKEEVAIFLGGNGYIFVKEDNSYYIDKIENTADEIKLLQFFDKHKGVCIKPIINDFRSKIFAHYSSFISVDNKLKESFKLSNVRINTSFDYEHGVISCAIKYTNDDVEVKEDQLTQFDIDRLNALKGYLSSLGFNENGFLTDESKVLSFFRMDFTKLRSLATVYLSDSLLNKKLVSVNRQIFRIKYNSGIMELFLEKSEFSEKELAEILAALKKKKKYILLKDNRIVDLDNEEAKEFGETVDDFQMDANNLYAKRPVPMVTAIKALAHQRNCHVDKYLRNMMEDLRSFKSADIKLPSINAKLRGYQIEGYNWLSILSSYGLGGILADDMGLGKTIQMIALIKADKKQEPSLIVCPKSLVFNWKSEFLKFDGKTEVVEIYGPESVRSKLISSIDPNKKVVYITSIDSLRSDIKKYDCHFNYAVIDEAQYIRNIYAQKTKSVKSIDAEHRFALTGTPIENNIADLWSIFDFIMPGYLEDINIFKSSEHEDIRRKVAPFILRRTKEDVLTDLPPKYERILSCEMDDSQRLVYEAERTTAAEIFEAEGRAFDILPYLTRLRQICIDPALYLDKYKGESAKFNLLKTLIPDYLEKGHRILVFSQFVKALEALGLILDNLGVSYFILTGDTPAKKRIEMMNDFNEAEGPDVFLISLKAGGTGLNLTGADTVIHIDPWWNAAAEDQADDRTHRIGQKRNVEVIKLIAEDSIEQRVLELQEIKKDIIDKVISKDDSSVVNATIEDIAFILKK